MEKNTILSYQQLTSDIFTCDIYVPDWASHVQAGQFIMLRVIEKGERFPLTIVKHTNTSITIVFKVIGFSTKLLSTLKAGDVLYEVLGPLGQPSILSSKDNTLIIGGGVGNAIAYAIAKHVVDEGNTIDYIGGYKFIKDVFYIDELKALSDKVHVVVEEESLEYFTGNVMDALKSINVSDISQIFCAGPLKMMQVVSDYAIQHQIPVVVSLNPIMVDGIGMCGGCRVDINNEAMFACVDGPEFDGALVDFEQLIKRNNTYVSHPCVLEKQL